MDFSDTREKLAAMPVRFWAGVPKVPNKDKDKMAIYTCFIQHVVNSLKKTGKGAIVVPTGFITAKSGVEKSVLQKLVEEHIVYGCISMPSNVFATTGTNVSVLFFDNSRRIENPKENDERHKQDSVILIDASRRLINNYTTLTTRASFNEDIFSFLKVYLPEYHSQEKIGHTLYLIEQKIENNNCINDNLANHSAMVA